MKLKATMGMILILLPTLLLTGFSAPALASGTNLTSEISIGAILSMTGDLATFGENEKVAAEFAVGEVNEFLQAAGEDWTMKLVVEDTQTKPDICLEKVESLAARGIKLLLGPLSSGEVRAIKTYCDSNKILVISQSSTAPDLAIADDYIFRFCPSDMVGQGPAIGRIMYDDGKKYIIPVTRNDPWGVGLETAAKLKFEGLGGTFLPGIRYSPEATEFSVEAADLASRVSSAIATYGADQVAVLHISFEEVNAFMTACRAYPVLDDIKWYGSDGTATSGAMLTDADVRNFAMAVKYPCTIFAPMHSDKWEKVRQNGIDVLGREPECYSYAVYDIVWVYALSLLEVGAYDSEAVRAVLPTVTRNYFGASGWIELDDAGDRKAGDYEIWQITEISPGTYDWTSVGKYLQTTDSVVWSPFTPTPVYVFEPVWNGKIFYVVTESNSTVSDYYLNPNEGPFMMFNVTGPSGTVGFCRVAIPKRLLWVEDGNWTVLVGGNPVNATVIKEDDYYTHLYFKYSHSTKTVKIIGTHVITLPTATSTITIALSQTSILLGENVTISGAIDPMRPSVAVTILYRLSGGTWTYLATLMTDQDSQYSYTWTPGTVGIYEVKSKWKGDLNTLGAESSVVTITVGEVPPPPPYPYTLDVEVDVGSIHFRGEMAEFYVSVSLLGKPVDADISTILYYTGTLYANLSAYLQKVETGLYRIPYTIPTDAPTGTYVLVVKASYLALNGTSLKGFLLSPTLTGTLIYLNGTVAWIKTDVGIIETDIANIELKVTEINGNIATINSTLGTIQGRITSIEGSITTIETDVGTIKTMLEGWTGGTTGTITTPAGSFKILVLTTSTLEGPIAFSDNVLVITLSGLSGTAGTTNVVIPKQLLVGIESSIEKVVVTIDDERVIFTYTENSEAYVLRITYTHSTRLIKIYIKGLPPTPFPAWVIVTIILIVAVATGAAFYMLKIRKPRIASDPKSTAKPILAP